MTLDDIWNNPLTWIDSYSSTHHFLKENQDWELSHIYNRARPMVLYGFSETVLKVLNRRIYEDQIEEASEMADKIGVGPFPIDMLFEIAKDFKGRIPLEVKALPDGTWVPKGTPFAWIRNTEPGFGEMVTLWEAMFLHASFPSGCATRACELKEYLVKHQLPLNRFHSFGFRGHSSLENAYWASTAWNLFLTGSDDFMSKYHTPKASITSIPATAHKTIMSFADERHAYWYSIVSAHQKGHKIVAIVIDTYNADRFIEQHLKYCADTAKVLGMHVVFRPDSGNVIQQAVAIHNVCTNLRITNASVIIGEGITFEKIKEYDAILTKYGVPLAFVSYGIGAGFYKDIDRDYLGWAMKTARSNGRDVMKFSNDPIKQSIPGEISITRIKNGPNLLVSSPTSHGDLFQTIYAYNERSKRPECNPQSWDDIHYRCKTVRPEESMIVLSIEIQDKIQEIKKRNALL